MQLRLAHQRQHSGPSPLTTRQTLNQHYSCVPLEPSAEAPARSCADAAKSCHLLLAINHLKSKLTLIGPN